MSEHGSIMSRLAKDILNTFGERKPYGPGGTSDSGAVAELLANARENEKVLRRMRNYLVLMPNYEAVKDAVLEAIVTGLEEHADATLKLINKHDIKQEDNKDEQG